MAVAEDKEQLVAAGGPVVVYRYWGAYIGIDKIIRYMFTIHTDLTAWCCVCRRRWYILAVFSLLAMFQCCVWNTWGPVVDVVTLLYPAWSPATVSLLANWSSIAFLVFMVPVLYLQNTSLRYAILLTSCLMFLGTN